MQDEIRDEAIDELFELIADAENEEQINEIAKYLAGKSNLTDEQAYMFVKSLRTVINNDYILLDTMSSLIGNIVSKLNINGALTDEDVEEIKKGN